MLQHLKSIFQRKIGLLLVIWLLSVCIRIPFLNRPLSIHHEWMVAHLLITLQIWEEKGISKAKYALIYTYPQDKANAHLDFIGGLKDEEGNYYYVSYPPFAFFVAYAFCKVFFLPINPISIQILNLLWHFVCAYGLYKCMRLVWNELCALWGFALYLFLPFNLWYHGNAYFVDIFVQGLWIGYVYFWLKIHYQQGKKRDYVVLFILAFLMMYTEWLAAFVGLSTLIISIVLFIKERNYKYLIPTLIAGIAMVLALALTLYQYANIKDFNALKEMLLHKYEFRSGRGELSDSVRVSIYYGAMLVYHYINAYSPLILFIFIAGAYIKITQRKKLLKLLSFSLLILLVLPVILHHSFLFGFTYIHEFSVLKSSFILIMVAVGLAMHLKRAQAIVASIILLQVIMYYGAFHKYTDAYKTIGETIKKERKPNELVVLAVTGDFWAVPQIMYYAHANFYYEEKQLKDLPKFLQTYNLQKYVVFYVENDKITAIKHCTFE